MHFGAQWGTHIALGVCSWCECTLDGLNAEHKFRVWVTILVHMSHPFTSLHFTILLLTVTLTLLCPFDSAYQAVSK